MLEAFAAAIEATAPSQALRSSLWLYPLVNTGHVVGIALLLGGIAPLDLRLLGAWRGVPLAPLVRVLVPMAMAGLVLAAASGLLLFVTRPTDYVVLPLFGLKLGLIAAAVLNALWLRRSPRWGWLALRGGRGREGSGPDGAEAVPASWRIAAALSLALWIGVVTAGRLIGYR